MIDSKSLMNREEIRKFLKIGKTRFYALVREGLPVRKVAGGWAGNQEDIDRFIRKRAAGEKPKKKDI